MNIKKNFTLMILSLISLFGGIWAIKSVVSDMKLSHNIQEQVVAYIDTNNINIEIDDGSATIEYLSPIIRKSPQEYKFSIDKNGLLRINDLMISFDTPIDSILAKSGNPDRYKKVLSFYTVYIFDKHGFYIKTDKTGNFSAISFYFSHGVLDISPKSLLKNNLTIEDIQINKKSESNDLVHILNYKYHQFAKDNYIKEYDQSRVIINYDSPENQLVNVMYEVK